MNPDCQFSTICPTDNILCLMPHQDKPSTNFLSNFGPYTTYSQFCGLIVLFDIGTLFVD